MTDSLYAPGQLADPTDCDLTTKMGEPRSCSAEVNFLRQTSPFHAEVVGWYCTRPSPHIQHVACADGGLVVAVWDAL